MSIQTIKIVFFSGTGGTRRVVDALDREITSRGLSLIHEDLDHSRANERKNPPATETGSADITLLVFPLHAFDAPDPIYTWLSSAALTDQRIAVLSTSGGGEGWPNTGCRNNLCALLEQKGAKIVYERMLCLPCNWTFPTPDQIAMWELRVIPEKVNRILDDLQVGKVRRTKGRMSSMRANLTRMEKQAAQRFPESLTVTDLCTGCGLCSEQCPTRNIDIRDGKPVFGTSCVMCFRCVYSCPKHALQTKNFMLLKEGFDLRELERRMNGVELQPVEKCCKGMLWSSVREYLLNPDL